MNIAIIGLGEVGRIYAQAMVDAGLEIIGVCEPSLSPASNKIAEKLSLAIHNTSGPWLQSADLVISAVTGQAALAAALATFPFLLPQVLYADFTTASPADMRAAAKAADASNLRFVDVAIMGGITLTGAKTTLLCAGHGAEDVAQILAPLGGKISVLAQGQAGDAVTLKLLRSLFTKGLEALAVETLTLAENVGLKAQLYENLADIDAASLPEFLDMLVRTHVLHADRRYHEVETAEAQLRAAGFQPCVTLCVKNLFDRSRKTVKNLDLPPDIPVTEALRLLIGSARLEHTRTT